MQQPSRQALGTPGTVQVKADFLPAKHCYANMQSRQAPQIQALSTQLQHRKLLSARNTKSHLLPSTEKLVGPQHQ